MKVVHYFCDFCKKDMSDTYTQLEDVVIEGFTKELQIKRKTEIIS